MLAVGSLVGLWMIQRHGDGLGRKATGKSKGNLGPHQEAESLGNVGRV